MMKMNQKDFDPTKFGRLTLINNDASYVSKSNISPAPAFDDRKSIDPTKSIDGNRKSADIFKGISNKSNNVA